jgi:hypothetical protein
MEREKRLILDGSPCDTNYFDRDLLTIEQSLIRGRTSCPNMKECETERAYCLLRSGLEIAQYVVKGSSLKEELDDFANAEFLDKKCWNSTDGKNFEIIQGKAKVLAAAERFARTVLLENPLESVLNRCEKCVGVKLKKEVYDSIHDGPFPLSGSGRTKRRVVEYCPVCGEEPRGTIIKEDPFEEIRKETEILRGFKQNY